MALDKPLEADFFTTDEVYQLTALVNELLTGVTYHFWVNTSNDQHFEVLDWLTLSFVSGNSITLTAGLETDGIKVVQPDFEAERKQLLDEFKGLVTIESRDASNQEIWAESLGKPITPSFLKYEGKALNDSMVLKFEGADDVEIYLGLEGLEIDYFEE
jgi:hypothetical protein